MESDKKSAAAKKRPPEGDRLKEIQFLTPQTHSPRKVLRTWASDRRV